MQKKEYVYGVILEKKNLLTLVRQKNYMIFLWLSIRIKLVTNDMNEVMIMLNIRKAEDFGLGFNCMARLYMDGYEEEILDTMITVCAKYVKWFSRRTIICSLHDLARDYPLGWNKERIPENQVERYEYLIRKLTKQGICKEKKESRYKDERAIIMNFCDSVGFINSIWGKEKCFARDSFYHWIIDNHLNEEVEIQEEREDETLPLDKSFLATFYKVCNYMIRYSYGRHTYMPSTSRDFVKANMEIMSDDALKEIVKYLKEQNGNVSEDDGLHFKMNSDN